MLTVEDVRAKLRNIGMLIAATENPASPILDSLRLQNHGYTVRLKSGLSFSLQPRCGDWFTLLECAVRKDYFRHGIEVREGDTVIDIGANFGAFSIAASQMVGDSGKVFCYEPNPFVFERLQENLRMNGCRNVTAFNEAVGARDGDVELFIGRKSAFSTTLVEVDGRQSSLSHSTKVPLRRIESVLRLAGPCVALLKIDCEGGEYRHPGKPHAGGRRASPPGRNGSAPRPWAIARFPPGTARRARFRRADDRTAHGIPSDPDASEGVIGTPSPGWSAGRL